MCQNSVTRLHKYKNIQLQYLHMIFTYLSSLKQKAVNQLLVYYGYVKSIMLIRESLFYQS